MKPLQPLLYKQGYTFHLNTADSPVYYYFDYNLDANNLQTEFQHFHQFYEILILLSGDAVQIIDGNYYSIAPYDIVLLHPTLFHKVEYPENTLAKRLCINFSLPTKSEPFSSEFAKTLSIFYSNQPILRFSDEVQTGYIQLLNEIYEISQQKSSVKSLKIHSKFIELLCFLKDNSSQNVYTQHKDMDSIEEKIHSITRYIHSHYAEDLTLDHLASNFFISPYYLSRSFKQVTGFTVIEYIQMIRVRTVQQYLLYTDITITEIAQKAGFNSFSQFNRVFNKFCGVSPSKFRANGTNDFAFSDLMDLK